MLVIANQAAFRVGGEGGFAGAGETKEHRDVARFTDVRRAVHRGNALERQQVVHNREHPLFHFAAVPGATDKLNALGQVKGDKILRVETLRLPLWVSAFCAVHDDKVRRKVSQLLLRRTDKHVLHEVRLPGHLGNKTHGEAGIGIRTAKGIDNKQPLAGELLGHQAFQLQPHFRRERLVVVFAFAFICPPYGVASRVIADNVLIFRRTSGKYAGIDGDSTRVRQNAPLISFQVWTELLLIQRIVVGVIDDILNIIDTISHEILRG